MHERVRKKTPDLPAVPNRRAIELQVRQNRTSTKCHQDRRENCGRNVQTDQHRGHIDWIATHPRNRPIIIGGGHPEHAFN
jgi:hypothetical protein